MSPLEEIDHRLEIVDALLLAAERYAECVEVIATSASALEAQRRLQDLLGVAEIAAVEVLNMQWRRLTGDSRDDLQARRDELQARRDELHARGDIVRTRRDDVRVTGDPTSPMSGQDDRRSS